MIYVSILINIYHPLSSSPKPSCPLRTLPLRFLRPLGSCDLMGLVVAVGKGSLNSVALEHQHDVLFHIYTHGEKRKHL